ncbi:hypothetical protein TMES_05840 [Thalassospira mesophila]|uniref:Uncharacterized protein n=1 Tax=Thalassospira mesophila TaxID=1293891 RepID=A0A1Y2L248_9PROT|nr:hypothetical protein TMES_05840 [Thalassospira mesophila]
MKTRCPLQAVIFKKLYFFKNLVKKRRQSPPGGFVFRHVGDYRYVTGKKGEMRLVPWGTVY